MGVASLFYFLLPSALFFPIFTFFGVILYFSFSSFQFLSSLTIGGLVFDELSLFMVVILFFVLYISYLVTDNKSQSLVLSFLFLFLSCYVVFTTSNILILYIFYELSLLPILYIIVNFGSYPDRSLGAFIILSYTVVLSLPYLGVLWLIWNLNGSFVMGASYETPFLIVLVGFLCFAVNLPLYGLHFWLPVAHVEAPTYGSMILAGVLLKLGGVGLIRLSVYLDFSVLRSYLFAYFVVVIVLVSVVASYQSDYKRLIAYSSVVHIMTVPLLLMSLNALSLNSIVMVMFFHGLSSSILFFFAGVLYDLFNTRQLVLMRGLILVSPLISAFLVLTFFFTLPAPPFPSFLGEVYFLVSSFFMSNYLFFPFILFTFFALVFNLNWLCSILFYSPHEGGKLFNLSFLGFVILASSFVFTFFLLSISGNF